MPDEKFFSFWSMKRSSPANATISSKRSAKLATGQPEERPVDPDVVARGELGVEPDPELDERRESSVDTDEPCVLAVDAGEDLEQRALAAAVRPDDAEELASHDREADVVESDLVLARRRRGTDGESTP